MIGPRASRVVGELAIWTSLGLIVAGAAGFAWLTRNPEAQIVATAAEWPVVGGLARLFQVRWVPPPGAVVVPGAAVDAGPEATRVWVPVREVEVEDFFDLPPRPDHPMAVHWSDSFEPWHGDGPPPLGDDPAPPLPLPGRSADPTRLDEARSFFGGEPAASRLGPYSLLTDVEDPALLATLSAVTAESEPLYVSRYGLTPRGDAAETIVLYRDEASYRRLQARADRIRGLPSRGHVGWGLVALYAGDVSEGYAVAPVLRHELGHLLNRRALGPALPPWLDEGLADDFGAFEVGSTLVPRESPLEALRAVDGARVELRGTLASLERLAAAIEASAAPRLPSLLDLDWSEFVTEPAAGLHYAASAWLVRYLLDVEEAEVDPLAFRAFLRQVASGGGVEASDLEQALGRPWTEVEEGWRRYVTRRAAAAGVGGVSPAPSAAPSANGSSSRQLDSPSA